MEMANTSHQTHFINLVARWISCSLRPEKNKHVYPNVATLARKWLSVTATSTPSERVFSICGIVDTARQNRSDCSMTVVRNTFCSHDC